MTPASRSSSPPTRTAWLATPSTYTDLISPTVATPATCSWTITVAPTACNDATWSSAAARDSRPYQAVDRPPADTAGFTTSSPGGNDDVVTSSRGSTHVVGTIGSPASSRSRRYRLSRFHATTCDGLRTNRSPPTHVRYSSGRSTLSQVPDTKTTSNDDHATPGSSHDTTSTSVAPAEASAGRRSSASGSGYSAPGGESTAYRHSAMATLTRAGRR